MDGETSFNEHNTTIGSLEEFVCLLALWPQIYVTVQLKNNKIQQILKYQICIFWT